MSALDIANFFYFIPLPCITIGRKFADCPTLKVTLENNINQMYSLLESECMSTLTCHLQIFSLITNLDNELDVLLVL